MSTFYIWILQTSAAVKLFASYIFRPLSFSGSMMLRLKSSWHETVFHLVWANIGPYPENKTYLYRNSNHTDQDQIADEYLESFVVSELNLFTLGLYPQLKS